MNQLRIVMPRGNGWDTCTLMLWAYGRYHERKKFNSLHECLAYVANKYKDGVEHMSFFRIEEPMK